MDVRLRLTYTGEKVTDGRGVKTPAGQPFDFGWTEFFAPIDWEVKFYAYDLKTQDPREDYGVFKKALEGAPLKTVKTKDLNFSWGGAPLEGVPANYFATVSEGAFKVKPGFYKFSVTSDDGMRVWIDNRIVMEDWTYHGPKEQSVQLKLTGAHRVRIEHFELDGFSALKASLKPLD